MAPTVLIASTEAFESGNQLAAALRRYGIRVELFRCPPTSAVGKVMEAGSRLLYHRIHDTLAPDGTCPDGSLARRLADPDVVSLEATDEVLTQIVATLGRSGDAAGMAKCISLRTPQDFLNKARQAQLATTAQVAIPHHYSDPAAVSTYPVIVKPTEGSGGEGIVSCPTVAELTASWRPGMLIQQLIDGETVQVGGVAKHGTVLAQAAYVGRQPNAFGQVSSVQIKDVPGALEISDRLVAELDYTGMFCIDLQQDSNGDLFFLEFNPRVFGSWLGVQLSGVDLVGAYRFAYGMGPKPSVGSVQSSQEVMIKHPDTHSPRELLIAGRQRAHNMKPILGWRGYSYMMLDLLAHIRRVRGS